VLWQSNKAQTYLAQRRTMFRIKRSEITCVQPYHLSVFKNSTQRHGATQSFTEIIKGSRLKCDSVALSEQKNDDFYKLIGAKGVQYILLLRSL
jgi:hypothetical protein